MRNAINVGVGVRQTTENHDMEGDEIARENVALIEKGIGVVQDLGRGTNRIGADGDARLRIPMMTAIETPGRVVAIDHIPDPEADRLLEIGMPILTVTADGIAVTMSLCRDPDPGPPKPLTGGGTKTMSAGATGVLVSMSSPKDVVQRHARNIRHLVHRSWRTRLRIMNRTLWKTLSDPCRRKRTIVTILLRSVLEVGVPTNPT